MPGFKKFDSLHQVAFGVCCDTIGFFAPGTKRVPEEGVQVLYFARPLEQLFCLLKKQLGGVRQ